ncbi:hypothetical protein RZS28_16250 [Methylocapsa polymorpha]|uniref:Uncharacterized protein n=1 Tax=Methylocapsa polymorpha TaxID=3080828 RepID=A0ABZ0HSF5_9HYPH|nr:hypothetical protein RZS28_16250 [Methylocapsa sp. RX1]
MGILVQLRDIAAPHARHAGPGFADAERFGGRGRRSANANAPLDCLAGGALASRFHAWRGLSGRRYVCSVFPAQRNAWLGGLPEFDAAVAIAVKSDAHGELCRIMVFEPCWRDGQFRGDPDCVSAALSAGVCEWHVHLLAESPEARRVAIDDLTH